MELIQLVLDRGVNVVQVCDYFSKRFMFCYRSYLLFFSLSNRFLLILSVIRINMLKRFEHVFLKSKLLFRRKLIHSIRLFRHRVFVQKLFEIKLFNHGNFMKSMMINRQQFNTVQDILVVKVIILFDVFN